MLVTYTGHAYLPEVIARLGEHLSFWWIGAIVYEGKSEPREYQRRVRFRFRPLLFFVPQDFIPQTWFYDVATSSRAEKDLHEWQQSPEPARYFIKTLTPHGGVVCDPFLGSGTFGVAALELGRHFIGIERDPGTFAIAQERLKRVAERCKEQQKSEYGGEHEGAV